MNDRVTRIEKDAVSVLCTELHVLYLKVGAPPFSKLQKLSNQLAAERSDVQYLSKSSINDTVRGKRVRLPDWPWVYSFVTVCHTYAARSRPPVTDHLADMAQWQTRWYRAKRACMPTAPWPIR